MLHVMLPCSSLHSVLGVLRHPQMLFYSPRRKVYHRQHHPYNEMSVARVRTGGHLPRPCLKNTRFMRATYMQLLRKGITVYAQNAAFVCPGTSPRALLCHFLACNIRALVLVFVCNTRKDIARMQTHARKTVQLIQQITSHSHSVCAYIVTWDVWQKTGKVSMSLCAG
jgi:hypothetical protein